MDEALERQARQARAAVTAGGLRGQALRRRIEGVPFTERDAWVDELLGLTAPPADEPLPPGAVPYLPCGVAEVLALVGEAPLTGRDTFVDLGSGLGRAVLLAHLLSGARALGLELQGGLVERARARAAALGLRGVSFEHADVTTTTLDGSVFFLYAPLNGAPLVRAVERLAEVARRRRITVAAVDLELAFVPWLRPRRTASASLTLYGSSAPLTPSPE